MKKDMARDASALNAPLPARRPTTTIPRWVKVSVVIILLLVLVFLILHLTGYGFGDHTHMSMIEAGVYA
jgi:hypothetical protein